MLGPDTVEGPCPICFGSGWDPKSKKRACPNGAHGTAPYCANCKEPFPCSSLQEGCDTRCLSPKRDDSYIWVLRDKSLTLIDDLELQIGDVFYTTRSPRKPHQIE